MKLYEPFNETARIRGRRLQTLITVVVLALAYLCVQDDRVPTVAHADEVQRACN